jgi:hypothetical protein
MHITKRAAKKKLGLTSDYALARMMQCTRAAVSQWKEDDPLPKLRQMYLRALYPAKFPEPKK